jgi:hypothetical protein
MDNILLVPIHIDLLHLKADQKVSSPKADFTKLPFVYNDEVQHANTANISESVLTKPFEQNLTLKKGLHLHWTLPDYLMQGKQNEQGRIEYPTVPNRWLITKASQNELKKQWLLESDYLYPEGETPADTIVYPFDMDSPNKPNKSTTQPFRYMGRTRIYSDSLPENSQDEYLDTLTAVGYGLPDFAAFYPNCRSVFGFYDKTVSELYALESKNNYYEVLGWYSDSQKDPVTSFINAETNRDYNVMRQKIAEVFAWEFSDSEKKNPQRMLCFGRIICAFKKKVLADS